MPRLSKDKIAELFPWETFPIRMEWKDKGVTRIAWFQCHEHMQKQYDRVKKPRLKVDVRYKDPELKPKEKPKRKTSSKKVTTTKKPASKKPAATKKASTAKKTTTKPKTPAKRTRKKKASS